MRYALPVSFSVFKILKKIYFETGSHHAQDGLNRPSSSLCLGTWDYRCALCLAVVPFLMPIFLPQPGLCADPDAISVSLSCSWSLPCLQDTCRGASLQPSVDSVPLHQLEGETHIVAFLRKYRVKEAETDEGRAARRRAESGAHEAEKAQCCWQPACRGRGKAGGPPPPRRPRAAFGFQALNVHSGDPGPRGEPCALRHCCVGAALASCGPLALCAAESGEALG